VQLKTDMEKNDNSLDRVLVNRLEFPKKKRRLIEHVLNVDMVKDEKHDLTVSIYQ